MEDYTKSSWDSLIKKYTPKDPQVSNDHKVFYAKVFKGFEFTTTLTEYLKVLETKVADLSRNNGEISMTKETFDKLPDATKTVLLLLFSVKEIVEPNYVTEGED